MLRNDLKSLYIKLRALTSCAGALGQTWEDLGCQ